MQIANNLSQATVSARIPDPPLSPPMKQLNLSRPTTALFALILLTHSLSATRLHAQATNAALPVTQLPGMVVTGEAEYEGRVQPTFLPPVQGTEIYSGKKASVIDLDVLPKVQANNYRQALALTPGLLYSEESSPLVSLGYRGIGEPHRMQYLQVLKDGIPIHADMFGYPEAYYTPPLDVVDRVEFVRGGAALMYGPHHAGALNYVTYQPRRDKPFSARSQHIFGSDSLYSTYNSVDGTVGRVGYLAYYNHRQSDGFRDANSDYQLDGGHFKLRYDLDEESHVTLAFDAYEEEHGEPGGLTEAGFNADPDTTTKQHDRFELRRYIPSVSYERVLSEQTLVSAKSWGGYYERYSHRQRGGGFGTPATGVDNNIERQEFYTFGIETRVRHDYEFGGGNHTFAGGLMYYGADSPREDRRGTTPDAENGPLTGKSQRDLHYGAVFFENKFTFDKFSVTPGLRLENIYQDVSAKTYDPATGAQTGSGDKDKLDTQPLVALGLAYAVTEKTEAYASVAQTYRTTIFTESVIPGSGAEISGDVDPSEGWTYELGYRGRAGSWVTWDSSVFLIDIDKKFGGTVTSGGVTELGDVGRTINYGWDAALSLDLVSAWDAWRQTDHARQYGSFSLYGNVSLLQAELHGGLQDGNTPQYAPDHIVRTGVIYNWRDRVKVAFLGTFVDDHFATDDENPDRHIPAYAVWDLTAEVKIYKDYVSLMAGVNNIFNEQYYARIRSDGIDPAYGRNFYAGFSLTF
jgi:Fe(3+) dicitrate transport protein